MSSVKSQLPKDNLIENSIQKGLLQPAGLLGQPKLPNGMSVSSSNQVCFTGEMGVDQLEQIGLVADVLQEIKAIFGILEKQNGEKNDFLFLLEGVRDRYPDVAHCPSLSKINAFIREHAFFSIAEKELEQFWS